MRTVKILALLAFLTLIGCKTVEKTKDTREREYRADTVRVESTEKERVVQIDSVRVVDTVRITERRTDSVTVKSPCNELGELRDNLEIVSGNVKVTSQGGRLRVHCECDESVERSRYVYKDRYLELRSKNDSLRTAISKYKHEKKESIIERVEQWPWWLYVLIGLAVLFILYKVKTALF